MTIDEETDEAITRELRRVFWRLAVLHGVHIGNVLGNAHATALAEIAAVGGDEVALTAARNAAEHLSERVLPG